jgi:hypothetical protein
VVTRVPSAFDWKEEVVVLIGSFWHAVMGPRCRLRIIAA